MRGFQVFAFFACLLCSVAFERPGNLRALKRQEVAPGTPLYECHANCGDTILISRTDNYCSNSTFTSDLNACLECALTEDIWQYYGDDVASAAKSCSDNATPSPSLASVATAAATDSVSTSTASRITSSLPTTTGAATPSSLGGVSSTSFGSIASTTSSSGSSPTSTAVASQQTGAASSNFGYFTASIGVFLTIMKLLQALV